MAETSKQILGKYELFEVIGDGAEGRVYRASCIADNVPGVGLGEMVAVKRLKSTGHEKESIQFRRQIEILSKLKHPNIVRHKDSFIWRDKDLEEDIHCLVMELLDGQPLKAVVEKTRGLSWETSGLILNQTLQALQYASKNGVIHRDLKPSNIYVTRQGIPKLVDFGIARQDDGESTATSSADGAKGTFDYMAPDFALQHGGFRGDEQSDIFSYGVILYYTLTGSLPFPPLGENADRGYYIRWLGQSKPVAEFRHPIFRVLSHARTCIGKCIDPDRQTRFKTFDEVMASFSEIGYRKLKHGAEVYEFTDWLGKGGFGEVFRARRVTDRRDVAVKRLFSSGQASRFVREAKILRAAAHPNLTEYVDFVEVRLREDEREFYLILEYLDGMPDAGLRDRIKNSKSGMDPDEALSIFVGYLDCLEHLHQNGIIHRDIKPGNLYAPAGNPHRAKIFDLGIAHDEEGTKTHGQVPGTLDFMPPEFATQTSGRGSAQSDIYSIGITLYQSLTKELPFPRLPVKESDAWVAFFKRAMAPVECAFNHPVFKTHPELVPLLKHAFANDPKHRFESAGAMRDELKLILQKWGGSRFTLDEEQPTAFTVRFPSPPEPEEVDAEAATKVADLPRIEREMARPADPAGIERQRVAVAELESKKREAAELLAKEKREEAAEEIERKKRAEAEEIQSKKRAEEEEIQRKQRAEAEAIERKKREEAEKVAREQARIVAEEAAKREREEAVRQAVIRAERAEKMRLLTRKLVKYGIIFVMAAGAALAAYTAWNKIQYMRVESAHKSATNQANNAYRNGDYNGAIAAAQRALTIHTHDGAMEKLIQDAQVQTKLHESYAGAMKSGQDAFDSHDYSNAVSWAAAALQKMPEDTAARKLQLSAQGLIDDYHDAVKKAGDAYRQNDFAGAMTAADKALGIFGNDAAVKRLKADAQSALGNQEAYRAAMKKAQAAFDNRDFYAAVAAATEALQKIPNDANATKLRASAQKYLDDYRDAVSHANAAFQNNDFEGAVAAADKALGIFSNDAAMKKLKLDAQAQAKLREAYTRAYKNAETAFTVRDYTNSLAWAMEALNQIPNDANASKLRDSAQNFLTDYHAALTAANSAVASGNFAGIMASADKALAIYPNDTAMQQLKANAEKMIANQKAYAEAMKNAQSAFDASDFSAAATWATTALQKIPNDAAATKLLNTAQQTLNVFANLTRQAQAALQKGDFAGAVRAADDALKIRKDDSTMLQLKGGLVGQLDKSLITLLESFNVAVPKELLAARGKKASTLGAIGDALKPQYQAQVDALEKAYRAGNWLGESNRQTSIQDLRKAIDRWE